MNQDQNKQRPSDETVTQVRGPELREKMKESQEKGDQFRKEHQRADAHKAPNESNTTMPHKANN